MTNTENDGCEWKVVDGYCGDYLISDTGLVKSYKRRIVKILKPWLRGVLGKYYAVELSNNGIKKIESIHRIVAKAFIQNPLSKPCINHIDGNKLNNNVSNLEWVSYSENVYHAYKNKLTFAYRGEDSNLSKLTKKQVIRIKKLHIQDGIKQKDIAEMFNVDSSTISCIICKKNWRHVNIGGQNE